MAKVKVTGELSKIDEEQRDYVNKQIDKFVNKNESELAEVYLKMDCNAQKSRSRNSSYICKVQATTVNGMFNSVNTEFGLERSLHGAINKIQKQISKVRQ